MKRNIFLRSVAAVFTLMLFTCNVQAGEATDRIKLATDKLVEILSNHDLASPDMEEKKAHMLKETVDEVFNWKAIAQRALGKHWQKLNPKERDEFVNLFGQLIEQTYMDKTRQYSGEQMRFVSEEIDGERGIVGAEAVIQNGTNISVEFRIMKKNEKWYIYDLYVEGVSLVYNYRTQFNKILIQSGYDELVKRLKTKLDA